MSSQQLSAILGTRPSGSRSHRAPARWNPDTEAARPQRASSTAARRPAAKSRGGGQRARAGSQRARAGASPAAGRGRAARAAQSRANSNTGRREAVAASRAATLAQNYVPPPLHLQPAASDQPNPAAAPGGPPAGPGPPPAAAEPRAALPAAAAAGGAPWAAGGAQTALVRVVITGGPCGGKSVGQATLASGLERNGLRVVSVGENATPVMANTGGYNPSWSDEQVRQFQTALLKAQLAAEDTILAVARLSPGPTVMICDRGTMDGKSFCKPAIWAHVLRDCGVTEAELLARYDIVVHLDSVGRLGPELYQYGEGSNNPSRFHDHIAAVVACDHVLAAYAPHAAVLRIQNTDGRLISGFANPITFEAKLDLALRRLLETIPQPIRAAAVTRFAGLSEADKRSIEQRAAVARVSLQLPAAAEQPSADPPHGQTTEEREADRSMIQAAVAAGGGIRPRLAGEEIDLSDDHSDLAQHERDELDLDEPRAEPAEVQRRHNILLAELQQQWSVRQAIGIEGITSDIAAGPAGKALAVLRIGRASAPPILRKSMACLGFHGGPHPAFAPTTDPSLYDHPAELEYFGAMGTSRERMPRADRAGPDRIATGSPCRHALLLTEMRLTWMLSIPDPDHPHFLPIDKLAGARAYNMFLGLLELQYEHEVIRMVDNAVQFERFHDDWDYDQPLPANVMNFLSPDEVHTVQQCFVCHKTGHCLDRCQHVTGHPHPRDTRGRGGGRKDGATNSESSDQVCFSYNGKGCTRDGCRYQHKCEYCNGKHSGRTCRMKPDDRGNEPPRRH